MSLPKPIKEDELRALAVCDSCAKKIMHTGIPLFYRVTVDRFGVRLDRAKQQDGLAAFLGSSQLAAVMGPNMDLAEPVMETVTLSLCEECVNREPVRLGVVLEMKHNRDQVPT